MSERSERQEHSALPRCGSSERSLVQSCGEARPWATRLVAHQ